MAENPSTQKQKHLADCCHDRISGLPECFLRYILSFLDIKDAFRTSFVSRSWRNLWDSHPCLFFSENFSDDEFEMAPFIDKVLSLYKGLTIREFHAYISYKESYASSVDSWIQFAVERNVEELNLGLERHERYDVEKPPKMPSSLFNCQSLRVLELSQCDLNLHGPVCLNSLNTLILDTLDIDDAMINAFISGSPFLKRLDIISCDIANDLSIFDPNGQLRCLKILCYNDDEYHTTKVDIYAPNLLWLTLDGHLPDAGYDVKSLMPHVTATFDFSTPFAEDDQDHLALLQLLYDVRHAKVVKLSYWSTKVLRVWAKNKFHMPSFNALHLELTTFLYKWEPPDFANLLRAFNHIESLTIVLDTNQRIWYFSDEYEYKFDESMGWEPEKLSFCGQFQHLKILNVCGLIGCKMTPLKEHETELLDGIVEHWENETEFVEFILKTLEALERMIGSTPDRKGRQRLSMKSLLLLNLCRKLLALRSALPEAEISLS